MAFPRPLREADLRGVEAVLTDVDGTLTTGHRLASTTLAALEALAAAGLPVVLVTGRPAGWAEAWTRQLPVHGVIAENGGLWLWLEQGALRRGYAEAPGERERNRARLREEVARVLAAEPGARLSSDSAYTEVDLAIDHAEDVRLGPAAAQRLVAALEARGVRAVPSSVHVNCWLGDFDKASAARAYLAGPLGGRVPEARAVYVGDSFNDAPMFRAFARSVGVANVRDVLGSIAHAPAYITDAPGGAGFEELARALLAARREEGRA